MVGLETLKCFCKLQYIEKYWTKTVPTDYPETDVVFSTRFSIEEQDVVREMEQGLGTDTDITSEFVPEGTYVSDYVGTFNLSGEIAPEGEKTLLSPVAIDPSAQVIAMHYVDGNWANVEDAENRDGYVYGTVESLSPFAIFVVKKGIEFKGNYLGNGSNFVVCNGNPVKLFKEDSKSYIQNLNSGEKFELENDWATYLVGGTADGSDVESANITVCPGVMLYYVCVGSYNASNDTEVVQCKIKDAVINMDGVTWIGAVTGSCGGVMTDNLVINITNSKFRSHIGAGESITYLPKGTVDANKGYTPETLDAKANFLNKKVTINVSDSEIPWIYSGPNTGMSYTLESTLNIKNVVCSGGIAPSSNGKVESITVNADNLTAATFESTNRGIINKNKATITNSNITVCAVGGDPTDDTVTGVINEVALDLGAGQYNLYLGTNGGHTLTTDDVDKCVDYVKYSRSADMVFSENSEAVLGNKLIIK